MIYFLDAYAHQIYINPNYVTLITESDKEGYSHVYIHGLKRPLKIFGNPEEIGGRLNEYSKL